MKLISILALAVCTTLPAFAQEAAFLAQAAGHEAPFRIGYSNGFIGNAWRAQHISDIEEVSRELKADGDFEGVVIVNSTSGTSGQIAQINSLIAQGVDALVVNPVSGEPLKPILARAAAAGVLVVVVDNPIDLPQVLNVPLNHTQYWQIETEWLVETIGDKGNIVAIEGLPGATASDWRVRARDAVLERHPDVKLLASVSGGWDQAQAREAMAGLLAAHGDAIDGVLIQEVMNEGALRAFTVAGKPLVPLTGDYVHSFLKLWKETPELQSIVVANPPGVGADAVRITAELLRGNKLKDGVLEPNPLNPDLPNALVISEPYVIEREANTQRSWCSEATKCISLDEALELLKGKSDSHSLDSYMSAEEIRARYFQN
ncbi:substrate-binding domain-containing protein [Paracoccus kondratievae]|uniref:substrate-binding domain-containing protein n=1 Tax=Paracoccus kondratievae TaxID=135740 RepID=UPI00187A31E3|nr:substrate-binding domain-containing protein [Paracoccus kondratievae]